jgi:hypothetical protein
MVYLDPSHSKKWRSESTSHCWKPKSRSHCWKPKNSLLLSSVERKCYLYRSYTHITTVAATYIVWKMAGIYTLQAYCKWTHAMWRYSCKINGLSDDLVWHVVHMVNCADKRRIPKNNEQSQFANNAQNERNEHLNDTDIGIAICMYLQN